MAAPAAATSLRIPTIPGSGVVRPRDLFAMQPSLVVLTLAAMLGIWCVLGYAIWSQFVSARAASAEAARSQAELAEMHVGTVIGRIAHLVAKLEVQGPAEPDPATLMARLDAHRVEDPDLAVRVTIDMPRADGFLSVGDPAVHERRAVLPIKVPIHDNAGGARGSLLVHLDSARLLRREATGSAFDIRVIREDGMLVAASGQHAHALGTFDLQARDWGRARSAAHDRRDMAIDASGDDVVAYRRVGVPAGSEGRILSELPLIVAVGLKRADVEATAWADTRLYCGIGAGLTVLLLAIAATIGRLLERQRAADLAVVISSATIDAVDCGIVVLDMDAGARVLTVNPALERMLDRGQAALLGQRWGDVIAQGRFAAFDPDEKLREITLQTPDGHMLHAEIRSAALRTADRNLAALIVTDVTPRHEAEQALLKAKAEAENASRMKSDFLATMSHELRTPLNAIIGFSEIISRQILGPVGSPTYREYAGDIHASAAHLLALINDILDLAKIEANTVTLTETEIDVVELLALCTRFTQPRAEQARITLAVEIADGLPKLRGDDLRMRQVVLNLVNNAIKFSPAGTRVTLTARLAAEGGIELLVRDEGAGLSQAEIALAMQPFRQIDNALAKPNEGAGLGLPLARRLTELHGGGLELLSMPGLGTTARVTLPAWRSCPRTERRRDRPQLVTR
jgi:signal transduction histidine kinase